jgi:hypothetical protein
MGSNGNGSKLQLCLLGLAGITLFKPNQLVNESIHFRAEKMGIYTPKSLQIVSHGLHATYKL